MVPDDEPNIDRSIKGHTISEIVMAWTRIKALRLTGAVDHLQGDGCTGSEVDGPGVRSTRLLTEVNTMRGDVGGQ